MCLQAVYMPASGSASSDRLRDALQGSLQIPALDSAMPHTLFRVSQAVHCLTAFSAT